MECIEARALKSSFLLSQMADSQVFQNDDVLATVNAAAPEDFPVEELLNLDFSESLSREDEDEIPQKESSNYSSSAFSGADEIDGLSELAVPVDDLDSLEWLSQFVDDSTSGLTLLYPAISNNREAPETHPTRLHVPVKPRSNRSRKSAGRSWSPFVFLNPVREKPVTKRQKRKPESETGLTRKCTHCQVQKTPQWRTGPLGPKTLCNACGVRFKSGRLFPEYRPAFSPSFSLELHSNSHRKVLEMRRKKDAAPAAEAGFMAVRDLVMAGSVEPVSV